MIVSLKIVDILYIHNIYLEDKIIISFLCSKVNLILGKIINRVKFVYLFKLNCCKLVRIGK